MWFWLIDTAMNLKLKDVFKNQTAVAVLVVVVALAIIVVYTRNRGVVNQTIRGCDPKGCGGFHASRGSREHGGLDLVKKEGQAIYAPISGKMTRHPNPYEGDNVLNGVEVVGTKYKVKIFYVEPSVKIGQRVRKGQKIGTAQSVAKKYGAGMTNHVHIEYYQDGKRIDPTPLFT